MKFYFNEETWINLNLCPEFGLFWEEVLQDNCYLW